YLPWILNKDNPSAAATTGVDNVSNVEQVTVYNPAAGTYQIKIAGTSVATGTNQQYAVSWTIDQPRVEMIYPNGAESFSPGSSEVITWNQIGAVGTQTLEYSLDNGATWVLIANNIASSATRFTWSVPLGVNTSQALVRITNGTLVDQSDAAFMILGTVTGFSGNGNSCAAGEINFSWNTVAGATRYDIYRLNETTGAYDLFAGNLTATSHTATGLPPGQSSWYTIRSRSTVTNAESERVTAITITASSGGGNMGTPGAITGETTICGTTQATYSISPVSGATGYVWSVPVGASILAGQGTNQITVTFPIGVQSGNVSVYATNSNCQTPAVQLAVSVGNSSLTAPVSGGNQQQLVCPGAAIPTLTATASVPAGQTIIWYTAATGGTVVTAPIRNTIGTVTYFAAARDNGTGCEGTARTGVTLTLTAVPAASITAGGPTTFCSGGSVTLNANNGTSYVWSNGQTGSSVTVNTSATLTVTVTTGSCVSTSAATVVTVNPLPVATITPLTATRVCDGDRVLLAASTGSTWSWSNGSTTQSVLVGTSGNYAVTVTNSFGCSAVSSPVAVTIEPNPVATLQASPYTNVLPGIQTAVNATVTPAGSYSYTWTLNNNPLAGETTATVDSIGWKYPSGSYKVRVQNNPPRLPCANTSEALIIGDSVTTRLFIFPSPNTGSFKVSYYSAVATTYSLQVFDSKGAMVYNKQTPATAGYPLMEVDLRAAQTGIYVVRLVTAANAVIATGKVVISR
ncbi:MAG: T9SS type A sorting domain-containing protein, partial [Sphingomonadales bacterium]